jgi:hypothetical protein
VAQVRADWFDMIADKVESKVGKLSRSDEQSLAEGINDLTGAGKLGVGKSGRYVASGGAKDLMGTGWKAKGSP